MEARAVDVSERAVSVETEARPLTDMWRHQRTELNDARVSHRTLSHGVGVNPVAGTVS